MSGAPETVAAQTVVDAAATMEDAAAAVDQKIATGQTSIALPKAGEKIARLASWAVTDPNQLNPAFFSFKDISCVLKTDGKPKVLLDMVSGYCKPGETLAIMGPSGAGKSTLLDVLAFRKTTGKWTQDIRLNGALLSKRTFVKESGYVTSDDLLTPELTCKEMLRFGAALRLPANWTTAQREQRISDVLEVMRLGYCSDRRIGGALQRGLSTGERKRLNVAMELLPVASVLFLDEPTTGLDSNTGREIIANVVEVTRLRLLACVATIHQPSYTILAQFDYILMLAKGKLCYYGRVVDAILYFESLGIPVAGNPAEVYADALAAQPDRLIEAWEGSAERTILSKKVEAIHSGQGSINDVVSKADQTPTFADKMGFYQVAPVWQQFFQLFKRQILVYARNPVMSTSRIISAVIVALFFGGAFFNLPRTLTGMLSRENEIFAYAVMIPGWGSSVIAYWVEKRKAYYHEEAAGYYHRFGHLLVMFWVEFVFLSCIMLVQGAIMFSMSGWIKSNIGMYLGFGVAVTFGSTGMNLLCAYCAASIPYANAAFTLNFFYSLALSSIYCTDAFLFPRSPSAREFFSWFSYARSFIVPVVRHEALDEPLSCTQTDDPQTSLIKPLDLGGTALTGYYGAAKNLTAQAAAGNPTIVQTLNSFGSFPQATAEQNATINSFWNSGTTLKNAQTSLAAAQAANNAADVISNLQSIVAAATAVFAAAANIPASNTAAINQALNQTVTAKSIMNMATELVANPLPGFTPCVFDTGEGFLDAISGLEWYVRNSTGQIVGPGKDNFAATSDGFYVAVAFITGVGWFILAYLCLWFCNFRQK
ncbi:hypothetical protein DFJ74DRAFT_646773 [Hyaloraphidium curvatum]|nr:hypothetical protein DFJ74DRAFT_646773 [Hyaloraphidium curvatum]